MGQIAAGLAGIEGKFQHLHTGQAGIRQQLPHLRREKAQILSNELHLGEPVEQYLHQIHARALDPMTVFGGRIAVRNGPITLKTPEMVDAQHIIQLGGPVYPANPPAVAVRLHGLPAIEGIAP